MYKKKRGRKKGKYTKKSAYWDEQAVTPGKQTGRPPKQSFDGFIRSLSTITHHEFTPSEIVEIAKIYKPGV